MIYLFTFILLLSASEPKKVFQLNSPQDVLLRSAETTQGNDDRATFKETRGFSPEVRLIQSGDGSNFVPGHTRVPRGAGDGSTKQRHLHGHRHAGPYHSNVHTTTPKSIQPLNSTFVMDTGSGTTNAFHSVDRSGNHNRSVGKGSPNIYNPLYPVTDGSYSAYAVMLLSLIVFAVGITGNLAVMCIVWHNYYMKSAWNSILAGLAFWDFLVLFFCLPVVVFNEITKKRLLGDVSCRIVPFLEVTSLGVATFSLCALGIDRFHTATSLEPRTQPVEQCHSILAKLAVVWIGSMILAAPELLLWQLSQEAPGAGGLVVESCSMRPSDSLPDSIYSLVYTYHGARMWWTFGCYFCLPLLFTLACQLVTRRVGDGAGDGVEPLPLPSLSSSSSTSSSSSSSSSTASACSSPKKLRPRKHEERRGRQLDCTVVALAAVYAACALPENVCNIALAYTAIQVSSPAQSLLALVNQFFLFFRSSVTPVLLLCLCKSLGQSFMDCCCCCCEECQSDEACSSSASPSTSSSSPSSTCRTAGGKPRAAVPRTPLPVRYDDKAKVDSSVLAIGTPC